MSLKSGRNPDALENIQLLKDGVKFSDVFTNGEDILDSEDLRIEFDLNILRCHGTDKGDIISESFSILKTNVPNHDSEFFNINRRNLG